MQPERARDNSEDDEYDWLFPIESFFISGLRSDWFRGDELSLCIMDGTEGGWENNAIVSKGRTGDVFGVLNSPVVYPISKRFAAPVLSDVMLESNIDQKHVRPWLDDLFSGTYVPSVFNDFLLLSYIYAVLWSQAYRARYQDFLEDHLPLIPLTSSVDLFRALAKLGGELILLHVLESPKLDKHITEFVGASKNMVEKVSWHNNCVFINNQQSIGFKGIPEAVWEFQIGGCQVCAKWLNDRKGRGLSAEDIEHYHRIVVALSDTIKAVAEIDSVIDAHDGFPMNWSMPQPVLEDEDET